MKHFPVLKTSRLSAQLRELTIGDGITIAGYSPGEAERTKFLSSVVHSIESGDPSPARWTVQERAFCVAYYLANTLDDGPDFSVGDFRYSDYLDVESDHDAGSVSVGSIGGDQWSIQHLTGEMAETIEMLVGEVDVIPEFHWLLGAMSAQMVRKGDNEAIEPGAPSYDRWLLARMRVFNAFPQSDFEELLAAYYRGRAELHHLFDYDFDKDGIVILPRQGGAGIPPARFPVRGCLSEIAIAMAGKSGRSG